MLRPRSVLLAVLAGLAVGAPTIAATRPGHPSTTTMTVRMHRGVTVVQTRRLAADADVHTDVSVDGHEIVGAAVGPRRFVYSGRGVTVAIIGKATPAPLRIEAACFRRRATVRISYSAG